MVLACIGHWYVEILYFAPVALVGGVLKLQGTRDRRADAVQREAARQDPRELQPT